jgi:DNA-binding protein YbaB
MRLFFGKRLTLLVVFAALGFSMCSNPSGGDTAPGYTPVVLVSIAVTTQPTKTVYVRGEALDISGLVVTGTYTDATTKPETVTLNNITGYNADTQGAQILTITINGKTTTFNVTVNDAALESIAVTTPPTKTVYAKGEALDISGLVVTGTYNDSTTKPETVTLDNITGYNALPDATPSNQTLTVTINGKTATFNVTVNAATLVSIAVTAQPTKTVYAKGEALDISGLVVTGTYTDATTRPETVTLSDITGYNADTQGAQTLTVTINGKTATFNVTVNDAALESIAVTTPPTKTVYAKGEALDISGLVVTGTYSDESTKIETVTTANITGYNPNTLGSQTLTVTINGKTTTFNVTVNAAALVSIAVTTQPTKTVYAKGEALDITGLVVTGTYTDTTTRPESVTLSDITGYNALPATTPNTQTLTVTVNGKTTTFNVTVNAAVLVSIAVTTPSTKTVYAKGEALDISGLVVTGTYTDATTRPETVVLSDITGYNALPATTPNTQTLTVTINGKTTTFNVTVNAAALVSITVTTQPTKTVYAKGEALDITGLVVTGTYTDTTTKPETVTTANITGYNPNTLGSQTLTVTVNGKTADFNVTVKNNDSGLTGFAVTGAGTVSGSGQSMSAVMNDWSTTSVTIGHGALPSGASVQYRLNTDVYSSNPVLSPLVPGTAAAAWIKVSAEAGGAHFTEYKITLNWPVGNAGLTITFANLEDENFVFPEETIYKVTHNGADRFDTRTLTLVPPEETTYTGIQWWIDGVHKPSADDSLTLTLNAVDYSLGSYPLTVEVWKGTVPYSKTIDFHVAY